MLPRKQIIAIKAQAGTKAGYHKGLTFTNEYGHTAFHNGNFIVTKKGMIINMNRNYDINGHNITSRHADSASGIPSKIGATDYRKRVPRPYSRLVRTPEGKLKRLKESQMQADGS